MTGATVVAALLAAAAVLVPDAGRGLRGGRRSAAARPDQPAARDWSARWVRGVAAAGGGLVVGTVVGGAVGWLVGLLAAATLFRVLDRLTSAAVERRRRALRSEVPLAADLLAATVSAGTAVSTAVGAVGQSLGGPLGAELQLVAGRLLLGAQPREAWQPLLADPVTATLARPLARAAERGAPPAVALARAAGELRREAEDRAAAAAEVAAVRAVGPLGACFLPAFVLLGVVPLVSAMVGSLLSG